jgi:radical SAM protein with 4Fe4S-binding SPASM domain
MESIIIKPTLRCNANCPFCEQRLSLYRELLKEDNLTLTDWKKILREAKELGVTKVNISGGEPTLYPDLIKLVESIKDLGMEAHLKTNGYLIDKILATKLSTVGLDSCTISIYSKNPKLHNAVKRIHDSFKRAIEAIKLMASMRIETNIQTVLTPQAMSEFSDFLNWGLSLPINYVFISYLEGDSSVKRPSVTEIKNFKKNQIPQTLEILDKAGKGLKINSTNLEGLFNLKNVSDMDLSSGIYNCGLRGCGRNQSMAIVLANGDVHPCNAVEYFHEPVVGNIKKDSLKTLWDSKTWLDVRKEGLAWCDSCPMNRHTFIKLKSDRQKPSFYSTPGRGNK